ncbi:MAG: toxin-antitoxin system HicB family antitoxin [Hyphomicrobium sp.]
MTTANYALRLQASLKAEAEKLAEAEGTTLNQFINVAVAEKIAALKTVDYLKQRASRGSSAEAMKILEQAGRDGPVADGDAAD